MSVLAKPFMLGVKEILESTRKHLLYRTCLGSTMISSYLNQYIAVESLKFVGASFIWFALQFFHWFI